MTLIVSVRIPDGVVIAGDSLSTVKEKGQLVSNLSHAQKVFPFCGRFGVGIYGAGLLANKSVHLAMRLFEQDLRENGTSFKGVAEIAEKIGDHFHNLLKEQLEQENKSLNDLPQEKAVLGFHIVGCDDNDPKTVEVHIGKNVHRQVRKELGCTYTGSGEIVQAIWGLYKTHPENQPPYPLFSLQDAINYAEFLIQTTIVHQRFSRTIPNVGGDIDVALVTPFNDFQWICQKPLGEILEGTLHGTGSTC